MKKILIILTLIITIIIYNKEYDKILIPKDSIRIRVVANSNNIEDQLMKLKVKNNVEQELYKKLQHTNDINEAREKITSSLPNLNNIIKTTIHSNEYSIKFGENYFPEKEMNGINYKEGNYESLVIELGKSQGNNWWCVLFPPLCMIEVEENDKDFVEYKSKVLEILKEYN